MKQMVLALCFLALGACEHIVHSDTKLSQSKIALHESSVFREVDVVDFDAAALAQEYSRVGASALDIGVSYDPAVSGAAMRASRLLSSVKGDLAQHGVDAVNSTILPVEGQNGMRVLVAFVALDARGPDDCELMPGLTHHDIDPKADYKIGCSLNSLIARQVARPHDLAGGPDADYGVSDGRRATNVNEPYRAGVRNEPLEGEVASE